MDTKSNKTEKMSHKNYSLKAEELNNVLPLSISTQIADYFAQGKSVNEVVGIVRYKGKKINPAIISELYRQIKMVETFCVNVLNGTSLRYNASYYGDDYVVPEIPTTEAGMRELVMLICVDNIFKVSSVCDEESFANMEEQINHVIDNVISWSDGTGAATFEYFYNAVISEAQNE